MHQVYAYGVIAPSRLVELDGPYPAEAGYAEISHIHPSLGGEAAAGAYVLARLGVPTKLSGNRLGNDSDSRRVIELLSGAGVDCTAVANDAEDPVTELVVSGTGERTVFGSYTRMLSRQDWSPPSRDDTVSSRVVCLDPFFGDASEQVGRWCRDSSTPYVTIDAQPDSELARHAEVIIVSEEFTSRNVAPTRPHDVMAAYTAACNGLVILTRGSEPLLFAREGAAVSEFAPYRVEAKDTTGAGDSFRAGIIFGMLLGYGDRRLIETASAVAAMVSQHVPGVLNSPTIDTLERFVNEHR